MTLAIETCGLTRRFGGRTAVQDLAMQVPAQAVYGFLGPNGAGKTTTLKMLLGLIRPSEGRALIEGIDVAADRMGAARKVGSLLEEEGFAEVTWAQTLTRPFAEIREPEPPMPGHGQGTFCLARARKPPSP